MTTQELKKIIKESIREELKDLLVEAVEIASRTPLQTENVVQKPAPRKPIEPSIPSLDPISRILEETRRGMTREDFKQVIGEGTVPSSFQTGTTPEEIKNVDLSMIPGIGKAAKILKEAEKKDKERNS